MVKCMPKFALPRAHPQHPCQLHHFYSTRKFINEELERTKIRLRCFFASPHYASKAVVARARWLSRSSDLSPQGTSAYTPAALVDELTTMTLNFLMLRPLQQETNRMRKLLSENDPDHIRCCPIKHFVQEIMAFFNNILNLFVKALDYASTTIDVPCMNSRRLTNHECVTFWEELAAADAEDLGEKDKTLALLCDMVDADDCQGQRDALDAFVTHVIADRTELSRFNVGTMATALQLTRVYNRLYKSADILSDGDPDWWNCTKCRKSDCGLHGLMEGFMVYDPGFPTDEDNSFPGLLELASASLVGDVKQVVDIKQVGQAFVRHCRAACGLWNLEHPVLEEALVFMDSICNEQATLAATPRQSRIEATKHHCPRAPARAQVKKAIIDNEDEEAVMKDSTTATIRKVNHERILPASNFSQSRIINTCPTDCHDSFKQTQVDHHDATAHPPSRTIAKYHRRGYGSLFHQARHRKILGDATLHSRTWPIEDPSHYHDVWRIIFPLTREDRQTSRVSWPLFVQAIQVPPINCRVKKADGVLFVFERCNDAGGKEIFQCHAPHQLDWICQGDLYRYRKDMRDTFGLDAERIMLRGEGQLVRSWGCEL